MCHPPLAAVDGISPRRVVLTGAVPDDGIRYVAGRAGDSPYAPGTVLAPNTPLQRPQPAWFQPVCPPEREIPFTHTIVAETDELLIADKPPFLPTTPNGRLIRNTLLTRLRIETGNPHLVCCHRLDRLTSGLVVCAKNPDNRSMWQNLFRDRRVEKTYTAITSADLPGAIGTSWQTITLPLRKIRGARAVTVEPTGTPTITAVRRTGDHTVELRPRTGFTHQLRVVMNHLGMPVTGDDTYPRDKGLDLYDFRTPLALVAQTLSMPDPIGGTTLSFTSRRDPANPLVCPPNVR
ncbi:pseudouridine synthase [Corynebacterium mendelii]|uniref:RNA pseudouridylate synthase n=1 Tax=Corynebacterium mendelii TaxID=2765362 RepID=A0A939IY80_9CORY|nr:pseudouridine synthase [Corynebacterium mendelii]MBN9644843.1 pseudouridine synthase [Corynebacterium mendelii]